MIRKIMDDAEEEGGDEDEEADRGKALHSFGR